MLKMCSHDGADIPLVTGARIVLTGEQRYYSKAVLGSLHRAAAVQEWARLRDGQEVSLERALAAFDMFVLLDNEEDFDSVSAMPEPMATTYSGYYRFRLDSIALHTRFE